jgi:hypothetical protein
MIFEMLLVNQNSFTNQSGVGGYKSKMEGTIVCSAWRNTSKKMERDC